MHGFAYYEIDENKITLSRDHAGIKPVYYAEWDIVSLMSALKNRKIVYKEVSKFPS